MLYVSGSSIASLYPFLLWPSTNRLQIFFQVSTTSFLFICYLGNPDPISVFSWWTYGNPTPLSVICPECRLKPISPWDSLLWQVLVQGWGVWSIWTQSDRKKGFSFYDWKRCYPSHLLDTSKSFWCLMTAILETQEKPILNWCKTFDTERDGKYVHVWRHCWTTELAIPEARPT